MKGEKEERLVEEENGKEGKRERGKDGRKGRGIVTV